MKMSEAMKILRDEFPVRSVFVNAAYRWIQHDIDDGRYRSEYTISVLPGWDGTACSQVSNSDLAVAVDGAIKQAQQSVGLMADSVADVMKGEQTNG